MQEERLNLMMELLIKSLRPEGTMQSVGHSFVLVGAVAKQIATTIVLHQVGDQCPEEDGSCAKEIKRAILRFLDDEIIRNVNILFREREEMAGVLPEEVREATMNAIHPFPEFEVNARTAKEILKELNHE